MHACGDFRGGGIKWYLSGVLRVASVCVCMIMGMGGRELKWY